MAIVRFMGALAFVLGVALLALDAARSLKIKRFEATSLERLWTNLGGDGLFPLRLRLSEWIGANADTVLDLPAAFIAFGLGMALLLMTDGALRDKAQRPVTF